MSDLAFTSTLVSRTTPEPIVGGRYALEHLIAEGGMALVYRGRHLELDQTVAIKVVRPELAFDGEATARFLNEARTIAKLRGPHIARVLDSGCSEPGRPFMVLEFLDGGDLRKLLDVNSSVTVDAAVSMALQAAEALAEAHAHGIVHRDIKPENLFLARGPDGSSTLKVLDFGICKQQECHESSQVFTLRGRTVGSPHYMAPEQITSPETVDTRADIWALGVVLFELVSGYQPFSADSLSALCAQVVHAEPRKSLRKHNPEVPAELERVILRCIRKEPSERYQTVYELAAALAPFTTRGTDALERIRHFSGGERSVPRSLTPLSAVATRPPMKEKRPWTAPALTVCSVAFGLAILGATYSQQTRAAGASVSAWLTELATVPAAPSPSPTRLAGISAASPPSVPAEPSPALEMPPPAALVTLASAALARDEGASGAAVPPRAANPARQSTARPKSVAFENDARVRSRDRANEIEHEALEAFETPSPRRAPVRAESVGLISPAALERAQSELLAPYDGGS